MTNPYIPVRRQQNKIEIDRKTWADTADSRYQVNVYGSSGEFLTREIYFGRAYEEPPLLNWASIVDPGAFIPDEGCEEPWQFGENILHDPDIDFTPFEAVSGRIPIVNQTTGDLVWNVDGSPAPYSDYYTVGIPGWTVSTANPRTGTRHLRSEGAVFGSTPFLTLGTFKLCSEPPFWQQWRPTVRVGIGDLVYVSGWGRVTSGNAQIRLVWEGMRCNGDLHPDDNGNFSFFADQQYRFFQASFSAPGNGTEFIQISIHARDELGGLTLPDGVMLDLDNLRVEVLDK